MLAFIYKTLIHMGRFTNNIYLLVNKASSFELVFKGIKVFL